MRAMRWRDEDAFSAWPRHQTSVHLYLCKFKVYRVYHTCNNKGTNGVLRAKLLVRSWLRPHRYATQTLPLSTSHSAAAPCTTSSRPRAPARCQHVRVITLVPLCRLRLPPPTLLQLDYDDRVSLAGNTLANTTLFVLILFSNFCSTESPSLPRTSSPALTHQSPPTALPHNCTPVLPHAFTNSISVHKAPLYLRRCAPGDHTQHPTQTHRHASHSPPH